MSSQTLTFCELVDSGDTMGFRGVLGIVSGGSDGGDVICRSEWAVRYVELEPKGLKCPRQKSEKNFQKNTKK